MGWEGGPVAVLAVAVRGTAMASLCGGRHRDPLMDSVVRGISAPGADYFSAGTSKSISGSRSSVHTSELKLQTWECTGLEGRIVSKSFELHAVHSLLKVLITVTS